MPDKDIFNKDTNDNKGSEETIITPDNNDKTATDKLLAAIVNEDGAQKYKNADEALVALSHAQVHIKAIESDNAALKMKGDSTDKLDELLNTIKQSQESGKGEKDTSAMSTEDVLGIVKEFVNSSKAEETETSNIKLVTDTFSNLYGKDASDKLYEKADDLGLSREEINRMIATNPNSALKILNVEVKSNNNVNLQAPSGVSSGDFQGTPDSKPKSAMSLSSAKDLTDNWNQHKAKTYARLGIETPK